MRRMRNKNFFLASVSRGSEGPFPHWLPMGQIAKKSFGSTLWLPQGTAATYFTPNILYHQTERNDTFNDKQYKNRRAKKLGINRGQEKRGKNAT